jgi:hypothetical protein
VLACTHAHSKYREQGHGQRDVTSCELFLSLIFNLQYFIPSLKECYKTFIYNKNQQNKTASWPKNLIIQNYNIHLQMAVLSKCLLSPHLVLLSTLTSQPELKGTSWKPDLAFRNNLLLPPLKILFLF